MLRYQIDIQLSAKSVLILKIYEGDSASEMVANLRKQEQLKSLDEASFQKIERVIRLHASRP